MTRRQFAVAAPLLTAIVVSMTLLSHACVPEHRDQARGDATLGVKVVEGTQPSAPAAAASGMSALNFPVMQQDEAGRDLIRVRVFPHPAGDPWKGGVENGASVTIVGDCTAHAGLTKKPGGKKQPLATKPRWTLVAAKLKKPLWLDCKGPALVERNRPLASHKYEGKFYVRKQTGSDGKDLVEIINVVPMEVYLRGVVPSEVIPSWPAETLKAQAIAARTYAYFNVAHNLSSAVPRFYDVDDTPFFQAYSGLTSVAPSTDQAIAATEHLVMSFGTKAILTFFHTDAGGHTESAEEVFGINAPYCIAQPEAHDWSKNPTFWDKAVEAAELQTKLVKAGVLPNGRTLASWSILPADRTKSGRVRAVTLTLDDGRSVRLPTNELKPIFPGLRSTLFDVTQEGSAFKVKGKGAGHGVGLSQKGAKELALQKGWDHKRILHFYYVGTAMCSLSKSRTDIPACSVGLSLDKKSDFTPTIGFSSEGVDPWAWR